MIVIGKENASLLTYGDGGSSHAVSKALINDVSRQARVAIDVEPKTGLSIFSDNQLLCYCAVRHHLKADKQLITSAYRVNMGEILEISKTDIEHAYLLSKIEGSSEFLRDRSLDRNVKDIVIVCNPNYFGKGVQNNTMLKERMCGQLLPLLGHYLDVSESHGYGSSDGVSPFKYPSY